MFATNFRFNFKLVGIWCIEQVETLLALSCQGCLCLKTKSSATSLLSREGRTLLFLWQPTCHLISTNRSPENCWTSVQPLPAPLRCSGREFHFAEPVLLRGPLQNFMPDYFGEFLSRGALGWSLKHVQNAAVAWVLSIFTHSWNIRWLWMLRLTVFPGAALL